MGDDSSQVLQALLDRMNQGDRAAQRELLERACGRLRRLAGTMLAGSFPALRARHELDSVVNQTWLRLVQALDATEDLRKTLMAGFTTCRDVGSSEFIDIGLRNAVASGKIPGPRVLVAVKSIGAAESSTALPVQCRETRQARKGKWLDRPAHDGERGALAREHRQDRPDRGVGANETHLQSRRYLHRGE